MPDLASIAAIGTRRSTVLFVVIRAMTLYRGEPMILPEDAVPTATNDAQINAADDAIRAALGCRGIYHHEEGVIDLTEDFDEFSSPWRKRTRECDDDESSPPQAKCTCVETRKEHELCTETLLQVLPTILQALYDMNVGSLTVTDGDEIFKQQELFLKDAFQFGEMSHTLVPHVFLALCTPTILSSDSSDVSVSLGMALTRAVGMNAPRAVRYSVQQLLHARWLKAIPNKQWTAKVVESVISHVCPEPWNYVFLDNRSDPTEDTMKQIYDSMRMGMFSEHCTLQTMPGVIELAFGENMSEKNTNDYINFTDGVFERALRSICSTDRDWACHYIVKHNFYSSQFRRVYSGPKYALLPLALRNCHTGSYVIQFLNSMSYTEISAEIVKAATPHHVDWLVRALTGKYAGPELLAVLVGQLHKLRFTDELGQYQKTVCIIDKLLSHIDTEKWKDHRIPEVCDMLEAALLSGDVDVAKRVFEVFHIGVDEFLDEPWTHAIMLRYSLFSLHMLQWIQFQLRMTGADSRLLSVDTLNQLLVDAVSHGKLELAAWAHERLSERIGRRPPILDTDLMNASVTRSPYPEAMQLFVLALKSIYNV